MTDVTSACLTATFQSLRIRQGVPFKGSRGRQVRRGARHLDLSCAKAQAQAREVASRAKSIQRVDREVAKQRRMVTDEMAERCIVP